MIVAQARADRLGMTATCHDHRGSRADPETPGRLPFFALLGRKARLDRDLDVRDAGG